MKALAWWLYVWAGIILLFFLAPTLLSERDTLMVLVGIVFVVAYGVWSWRFWVKSLIQRIKEEL